MQYTPKVADDFGTIHCWAQNEIGPMVKPCIFHIVLKGEYPDEVACIVLNINSVAVVTWAENI